MEPSDIVYLAQIENSIGRSDKAIELMMKLADQKPQFDQNERQILVVTFKTAVDPIRETIRVLRIYPPSESSAEMAELFRKEAEASVNELNEICKKGIDLVEKVLLPACGEPQGKAFLLKLQGDFYRYMVEFATDEELEKVKMEADSAYIKALVTCKESLSPANPTNLGVILNYAVFKYDSLKEMETAKNMIVEAIKEFQGTAENLSENAKKESLNIVNIMQKNLISWNPDKSIEEEEEIEEEEIADVSKISESK